MPWEKVKSWSIGVACALILITHTPPVVLDPLKTAVSQMRQGYATTDPETEKPTSASDLGLAALKKILK